MYAQIDGNIQHARAFWIIHSKEKNIAPGTMRQIHPHRGSFAQNGIGTPVADLLQQLRPNPQRLIFRMAHSEHPLIPAHRSHTAPDLVRQCLERQPMIGRGERARNCVVRPSGILHLQKNLDRLLEPPLKQMFVPFERDQSAQFAAAFVRQVKAMNGIKEEKGADALVEVFAAAAKSVQLGALLHQFLRRKLAAGRIQRLVAKRRISCGDESNQIRHSPASIKTERRRLRRRLSCLVCVWVSVFFECRPVRDVSDPTKGMAPNLWASRRSLVCRTPARERQWRLARHGRNGR